MSIGFLGVSSSQRTVDVFSGNASSVVDRSLQGTLVNYSSAKGDLGRLIDNAVRGTFDITSQQYYNRYTKEAATGWAETWYAEYKAVLALRADALQKKLQAAYNRVLEKSVYAEIKPNSESVFAPYANRTFNVTDTNYKMPVSEVFYSDVTQTTTYTPDTVNPPNITLVNWTQKIREAIQRWSYADYLDTGQISTQGSNADSPPFNRNQVDVDGDGQLPTNDTGSKGVILDSLPYYYNDPRIILGLSFRPDPDGPIDEVANARKYNNVMSPTLRRYISTSDIPANNSVYRIENIGYNSSYNNIYFRENGTIGTFSSYYWNGSNPATITTTNPGGYSILFTGGNYTQLTTTQMSTLNIINTSPSPLAGSLTNELSKWTLANTGGALDISTGEIITNKRAAELKLTAGGGKIQVSPINGKEYNVATSTSHTRWLVDPNDTEDITGDGIAESLANFARLRDGTGYGLWIENYGGMNDKSTSAGDPNFGHIDSVAHRLVNPLLWDGIANFTASNWPDIYNLMDSREEAFRAVARNAQVDAAVKAVADALNNPTYSAFSTQYPEEFNNLIKMVEDNIRDIYAKRQLDTRSFLSHRDFLYPFGLASSSVSTINQPQVLYDNKYAPENVISSFDFKDVTSGTITVDIFGKDATSANTQATFKIQYSTDGGSTWNDLELASGGTTKTITAQVSNPFPDSYSYPKSAINLADTTPPYNDNPPYNVEPYLTNSSNNLPEMPGNPDYSDPGERPYQLAPDENGDGNPYNDIYIGGVYLDASGNNYNPSSYTGHPHSGYNTLYPVSNILHKFADNNMDGNPFNDESDPDNPGEFLDDPLNPRYNPEKYEIRGKLQANISNTSNSFLTGSSAPSNVSFRVVKTMSNGTATFLDNDDRGTPLASDDIAQKFKINVQRNITVTNNSHPWGSPLSASPFHLGIDYNSVGANSNIWKNRNGLYTAVRRMIEDAIDPIMNPPKNAPSTGGSAEPSNWINSYYDSDLSFDNIDNDDRIGNPKRWIPQFGIGDIDWSNVPSNIYDTIMNSPSAVGAINMALQEINKTFLGRQYNDIIAGSKYKGDYWSTSVSVFPGPLQFQRAIDETQSMILGGTVMQAGALQIVRAPFVDVRVGPNLYYGHLSSLSLPGVPSIPGVPSVLEGLPTIGMFGMMITLPIPFAPITVLTNTSYDLFADIFVSFMNRLKKVMVEAVQVQAYGASSGTAFDTYASRAEYHFSEPGFSEAMKQLKIPIAPGIELDFGKAFNEIMFTGSPLLGGISLLGNNLNGTINGTTYKERLFNYKHSVQGAETRETDVGAFFATNAFLSQFELDNLDYEYWIGAQQNEEYVNMDMQRTVITAGKELLNIILEGALTYAAALGGTNPYIGVAFSVAKMLLTQYINAGAAEMIYNFLYKDQNLKVGKHTLLSAGGFIKQGKVTTEAYDFIEPDKKPFEGDSDFNYKTGGILSFLTDIFSKGSPDFILDGYANTMRFRKSGNAGSVIGAAEIWDSSKSGDASKLTTLIAQQMGYNADNPASPQGLGPRANAGRGSEGFWTDTNVGDINEVLIGSRKVSFNDLSIGFNAFDNGTLGTNKPGSGNYGTQSVNWEVRRYTGASSRIYQNRYNAAEPVNLESFSVGMYSNRTDIGIDSVKGYYDRKNQYSLSFKSKYDNQFSLFGAQALNPTIGGGIKIAEIDKNKEDDQLLAYESGGITAVKSLTKDNNDQQFGASPDGTLNELNRILYEHLHLRADGKNLSLVNEYRDVFNSGFLKNIFVSGQSYHYAGGGINSSIQIRFDPTKGNDNLQTNTREYYDNTNYDPYYTPFLTRTKGKAEVFLSTYFAYKKKPGKK